MLGLERFLPSFRIPGQRVEPHFSRLFQMSDGVVASFFQLVEPRVMNLVVFRGDFNRALVAPHPAGDAHLAGLRDGSLQLALKRFNEGNEVGLDTLEFLAVMSLDFSKQASCNRRALARVCEIEAASGAAWMASKRKMIRTAKHPRRPTRFTIGKVWMPKCWSTGPGQAANRQHHQSGRCRKTRNRRKRRKRPVPPRPGQQLPHLRQELVLVAERSATGSHKRGKSSDGTCGSLEKPLRRAFALRQGFLLGSEVLAKFLEGR